MQEGFFFILALVLVAFASRGYGVDIDDIDEVLPRLVLQNYLTE